MAHSDIFKTKKDGTITFADNAGANTFTLQFEEGDLKINWPKRAKVRAKDRGDWMKPRLGDEQLTTGSFSAQLTDVADASYVTLLGLFGETGAASSWVSTYGANADVFAVKLTWTIEGTDHGDATDHVIELNHVEFTSAAIDDGEIIKISINFESQEEPALT